MVDLPLPPALAGDERMRTLAALSARISAVELSPLLVYLIDQVSRSALPVLAEQFHMQGDEGWLLAADDEQRRQLLKRAIEWHRYKGTRWALDEIFRVLGINVELVEWWQQKAIGSAYLPPDRLGERQPPVGPAALECRNVSPPAAHGRSHQTRTQPLRIPAGRGI